MTEKGLDHNEDKTFTDVMVDLETLGTGPNAPIVSIGAVYFNPETGELGRTFYRAIDALRTPDNDAEIDMGTVAWWMGQSEDARAVFSDPEALPIRRALIVFNRFLGEAERPRLWGNGAGFDNVILRQAMSRQAITPKWDFPNDRDVRTIVDLGRQILGINPKYDIPRVGTAHNALDDAIHQARYVSEIYQALVKATKGGGEQ